MTKEKTGYKLKKMYDGLNGVRNVDMTDKKAEKLIKDHPRGYDLFDELPVDVQEELDKKREKEAEAERKKIEEAKKKAEAEAEAERKRQEEKEKRRIELINEKEAERIVEAKRKRLEGKSDEWLANKAKTLNVKAEGRDKIISEIIKEESK